MDRVRKLLPGVEIRDFYTSVKEASRCLTPVTSPTDSYQQSFGRSQRPHLPPSSISPFQYFPHTAATSHAPPLIIRPPHS
uniref:Uncharacterized protein n=1 Tax=Amphimedon queenslandica TaxID=400682 RepID=A0A1X7VIY1_AMPQE